MSFFPQVHQFLQKVDWWLLQHCLPSPWPNQERQPLELEQFLPEHLQQAEELFLDQTCPPPLWHFQTLCHHWCLQVCIRWCTPASQLQWRVAPMLLPVPVIWGSRKKLQHLQQRTPCYHSWPQDLVPLPARIIVPSAGLHQPQKPHIFQTGTETQ